MSMSHCITTYNFLHAQIFPFNFVWKGAHFAHFHFTFLK